MSSQFYDPITYYVEQLFFVNLPRYRYLQYIHIPSTNKFVDSTSMIMRASPANVQFIFMARFFSETRVLSLSVVSIKLKILYSNTLLHFIDITSSLISLILIQFFCNKTVHFYSLFDFIILLVYQFLSIL